MRADTKRQRAARRALRALVPRVPYGEAEAILDLAGARHLRHLPPAVAVWLATTARIRHAHTEYEALLAEGYDRDAARFFVIGAINAVLTAWGASRQLSAEEDVAELD